jgi:N-acetylglucosaminyldiphosphoundecaprenol N-acetyl-beta-D-mannosaminyltransferase
MQDTVEILGFAVSRRGLAGDVARALSLAHSGGPTRYMACANAHSLAVARRNPRFGAALRNADQLLPDGMGVLLAARLAGHRLEERVAGFDFFAAFSRAAARRGNMSYFFLGSTPEVLRRIAARLARDYPGVALAGTYAPPFKPDFDEEDTAAMVRAVEEAQPTVLWIGMTAPKQEIWLYENRHRLPVPFVGLIGAAFDFYAGTQPRPPPWMQRAGLEWLGRFIRQPRRMWRRYFLSTPLFALDVLLARLRGKAPE